LVDPVAWTHFTEWPHHPDDKEEIGWTQGDQKLTKTKEWISLPNGDQYYGSILENTASPEGFGVLAIKKSKSIHQGFFVKGVPNGQGIYFAGSGV